jgi:hypothetical protein
MQALDFVEYSHPDLQLDCLGDWSARFVLMRNRRKIFLLGE